MECGENNIDFVTVLLSWQQSMSTKQSDTLAEFSVCTVNYGPSFFFPSIYGPRASRLGHKSMEKKEDP